METRKALFGTVVAALMAAAPLAHAAPAANAGACVFDTYAARSVEPYRAEENFGLGTHTGLRGAQLFVEAREGLTAQWLTREVQRALAAESENPCRPGVADIRVQVVSAGPGFWVQLIGADEKSGADLLRWARTVVSK